ncbi:hypothetical protein [Pedobacter psychroterrae]|uniref:Uncharacterized protein n=1 Tax=Pedobacter psychroterrae TaxID=2530453 RepID=A0A4R0NRR7_9SPHI|nr:hypothetical protein [Pedobacter psychroterrae]TCD03586.1 hypothetical protein EZ437_06420 [Pedobacter psychroterrae]
MVSQLSTNGEALRLFFTEDIYFVNEAFINEPVMIEAPVAKSFTEVPAEALIVTEPQVAFKAAIVEEKIEFKFLGKNKRHILILVNDDQHDVSDETGRELLRKIVKSVNLTADDFALLNYAKYSNTSFALLKEYFNSGVVFAFGVSPSALGLAVHPENTIIHEGVVKLIFSAGLPQLNEDANGKKALWGCLKNLGL